MSYVLTQPQAMATAAADVAGIGSAIDEAWAAAAGPTTGVAVAAADEVSAAAASLFNTYALECQELLINQATAFQQEFARVLAAAGVAYAEAEAAAAGALGGLGVQAQALLAPLLGSPGPAGTIIKATPIDPDVGLIMTGSGTPTPPQNYINTVYKNYIEPNFPVPSGNLQGVSIPNGLYPFTGVKDLTLDISLGRGIVVLRDAIMQQVNAGNSVVVGGYSQSSIVASMVMPQLVAAGVPSSEVNFVLLGNPANPNGGLLSRFPGLHLSSLGVTFGFATPANDYPTVIYTQEYDGFADFPQYPINLFSTLNALMGIVFVHGQYAYLDPANLPPGYSLVQLPTEGPTMTTYYMIDLPHLPLLEPIRLIPVIGDPIANALEGPLTPIVNWGYGDPAYGYSTGPANVPTPFGFLPPLSATTALVPAVVNGTQQGLIAGGASLQAELLALPPVSPSDVAAALTLPSSVPVALALTAAPSPAATIDSFIMSLQTANTNLVSGFATSLSTGYATLLPMADIATSLAISLPSYNFNLFLDGIIQAVNGQPLVGLVNAFGRPLAATVGLTAVAGGFGVITVVESLESILTGTPFPGLGNTYPGLT